MTLLKYLPCSISLMTLGFGAPTPSGSFSVRSAYLKVFFIFFNMRACFFPIFMYSSLLFSLIINVAYVHDLLLYLPYIYIYIYFQVFPYMCSIRLNSQAMQKEATTMNVINIPYLVI